MANGGRVEIMPHAPEVSVVVPVYNGARVIGECVASLLALQFPRDQYEILVVDNASTDGTVDLLSTFGSRIQVIAEARRGASVARNRGIREARGRLIAFTDADATVDAAWLSVLVEPLGDTEVGVVGGRILSRPSGNAIESFGQTIRDQRAAIEKFDPPYVDTCNWASRRDLLIEAGLFDEALRRGEDVDLAWRIWKGGHRLVYRHAAIVFHRNEKTVWGLVSEGFDHGMVGERVRDKHRAMLGPRPHRWWRVKQRLLPHLRKLVVGSDRRHAALALIFDLGKTAGELIGQAARARV